MASKRRLPGCAILFLRFGHKSTVSTTQAITKVLLALAIIGIAVGIAYEIRSFNLGKRRITRGQLRLRVFTATLLAVIVGMALAGSFVLPGHGKDFASLPKHDKVVTLSYWSLCLGLSFLVIVLALADLRACLKTYASQRGELHVSEEKNKERLN